MTIKGEWNVIWKDDDISYVGNGFREIGWNEYNYFLPRFEIHEQEEWIPFKLIDEFVNIIITNDNQQFNME